MITSKLKKIQMSDANEDPIPYYFRTQTFNNETSIFGLD